MPFIRMDLDRIHLALAGAWSHILARSRSGASAGLTARVSPDGCELTFWDSGPPLTPEGEAHVFDRREQALRGHELGSAFRMAMAGALVQAHGGRAQVGSLSGRTLFQLVLPLPGELRVRRGPVPGQTVPSVGQALAWGGGMVSTLVRSHHKVGLCSVSRWVSC